MTLLAGTQLDLFPTPSFITVGSSFPRWKILLPRTLKLNNLNSIRLTLKLHTPDIIF